jgi:mannose-6-phosphate isomerase
MIVAVTPFVILRGFRPPTETLERLDRLALTELMPEVGDALREGDLERFFSAYMALEPGRLRTVLERALARIDAGDAGGDDGAAAWVVKLEGQFPGDRGILAPLFLHLLELAPGEAAFTGPGVLHAYLEGTGVELMASSDNVVRGGLTPKHVDLEELLRILRFEPQPPRRLGSTVAGGERRFDRVAEEFGLSVVEVASGEVHRDGGGVEILLCSRGRGLIQGASGGSLAFGRGDSLFVPAAAGGYRLEGDAALFRAFVPAHGVS